MTKKVEDHVVTDPPKNEILKLPAVDSEEFADTEAAQQAAVDAQMYAPEAVVQESQADVVAEADTVVETESVTWVDPAWLPQTSGDIDAHAGTVTLPTENIKDYESQRRNRDKALGVVVAEQTEVGPVYVAPLPRNTDKWYGGLSLFLMRLIVGGLIGMHAFQHLTHWHWTEIYFSHSVIPFAEYLGVWVIVVECVISAMLIFGLGVRVAGVMLTLLEIGLLSFYVWGPVSPFNGYMVGMSGELELVLATVGVMFAFLSGGSWAIDYQIRREHLARKEKKAYGQL